MALKFLNKKGWHTGSLRNIENVWKAEQKHDAEQKKLDELRKQIQEERERSEFRLLQEQAGLVPKQERLDFLYDSGLAVGKGSSDGFKPLETIPPKTETEANSSSSKQSSTLGALFEDKPQSANDAWRKLHSDPLLLIRQREQEALARVKNNPIQMAMIRKSVESKQHKEKSEKKEHQKHPHKTSKHDRHSSLSKGQSDLEGERSKGDHSSHLKYQEHSSRDRSDSENNVSEREGRRKRNHRKSKHEKHSSGRLLSETDTSEREERSERSHHKSKHEKHTSERSDRSHQKSNREKHSSERSGRSHQKSKHEAHTSEAHRSSNDASTSVHWHKPQYKPRQTVSKLSEEERAARLREMQLDAELHEEQRWKRLKKAADNDTKEASQVNTLGGKTFLDAAQKSVYGAEKGGSSTIEESVRRRTYYLQGRSAANEGNAFRR